MGGCLKFFVIMTIIGVGVFALTQMCSLHEKDFSGDLEDIELMRITYDKHSSYLKVKNISGKEIDYLKIAYEKMSRDSDYTDTVYFELPENRRLKPGSVITLKAHPSVGYGTYYKVTDIMYDFTPDGFEE